MVRARHRYLLEIGAQGLNPVRAPKVYAVWLWSGPGHAHLVKSIRALPTPVKKTVVIVVRRLPAHLGRYRKILITLETSAHPTQPGRIVLDGPWPFQLFGS